MKTCETCKWFQVKRVNDNGVCRVEPPSLWRDDDLSAEVRCFERCSKWESKLERRCGNCEFFHESVGGFDQECRRHPPVVERGWPVTSRAEDCGECRGRE
jgi:hypothetical protein